MNTQFVMRLIGVALAAFIECHFFGLLPWGILSGVATALLFLPLP